VAVIGTEVGKTLLFQLSAKSMSSGTTIIIVTPESAVSKTFGTFLDRLQGLHLSERFVFDECCTPLDSTPEFRPKMRQLGELVKKGVRMVYLTAILPLYAEPEFISIMRIRADNVCILQAPTSRPNITYSVAELLTRTVDSLI
jgi:superfamily II DNA helicase RecQ